MSSREFANALEQRIKEYFAKDRTTYCSRFNAFAEIFSFFQEGQTVTQIATGNIAEDVLYTKARVGRNGRIILIDDYPEFIYNKALSILDVKELPGGMDFYVKEEKGRALLQDLFRQANIEVYVQHLPPYPQEISNASADYVMAINAAFELMSQRFSGKTAGPKPNVEGLIVDTYQKLKTGGSFIVQGLMFDDVGMFRRHVRLAVEKHKLKFSEDLSVEEIFENPIAKIHPSDYVGHWLRLVKKE